MIDLPENTDDLDRLAAWLVLFSHGAKGAFLSSGGDSHVVGDAILQEDGSVILQEQGGAILQEGP